MEENFWGHKISKRLQHDHDGDVVNSDQSEPITAVEQNVDNGRQDPHIAPSGNNPVINGTSPVNGRKSAGNERIQEGNIQNSLEEESIPRCESEEGSLKSAARNYLSRSASVRTLLYSEDEENETDFESDDDTKYSNDHHKIETSVKKGLEEQTQNNEGTTPSRRKITPAVLVKAVALKALTSRPANQPQQTLLSTPRKTAIISNTHSVPTLPIVQKSPIPMMISNSINMKSPRQLEIKETKSRTPRGSKRGGTQKTLNKSMSVPVEKNPETSEKDQIKYLERQVDTLKDENRALKLVQMRQDKALTQKDSRTSELPLQMQRQAEEIRFLRKRLRILREKIREHERILRERNDALQRALDKSSSLEQLMLAKSPNRRPKENQNGPKLEQLQTELEQKSITIQELNRRIDLFSRSHQQQLSSEIKKQKATVKQLQEAQEELNTMKRKVRFLEARPSNTRQQVVDDTVNNVSSVNKTTAAAPRKLSNKMQRGTSLKNLSTYDNSNETVSFATEKKFDGVAKQVSVTGAASEYKQRSPSSSPYKSPTNIESQSKQVLANQAIVPTNKIANDRRPSLTLVFEELSRVKNASDIETLLGIKQRNISPASPNPIMQQQMEQSTRSNKLQIDDLSTTLNGSAETVTSVADTSTSSKAILTNGESGLGVSSIGEVKGNKLLDLLFAPKSTTTSAHDA